MRIGGGGGCSVLVKGPRMKTLSFCKYVNLYGCDMMRKLVHTNFRITPSPSLLTNPFSSHFFLLPSLVLKICKKKT